MINYFQTIDLVNGDQRLLVTPDLLGRVFTCSAKGENGYCFGWLNYDLIALGKFISHCNNFSGEYRF